MQVDPLLARIRGEYREMPGLRLTVDQACRLWHMESGTCQGLLDELVREQTLYRRADGAYCAFPPIAPRPVKAALIDEPGGRIRRRG